MYEDTTYDVILKRMLDRVSDKLDKREGAVIFDTLSPTSIEFQILYLELDRILNEAYGDTASRDFLILRCRERGINPNAATYAILKGEFTPNTIDVMGKRFNIGEMNYTVVKLIEPGKYEVRCETLGEVGNQYLGAMMPIDYIHGLETAELTQVLIPGEDEEDTESLRERYFLSFESQSFGGNHKDYLDKTNSIDGVGCTKVTRVWNGDISPSTMIPSQEVTTWYNSAITGLPANIKQWLSTIYLAASEKKLTTGGTVRLTILDSGYNRASDTLIKKVQDEIDPEDKTGEGFGIAPIGHVVSVDTVTDVTVNIATTLTFDSGYSWSNLQNMINDAVKEYLVELRKTWANESFLTVRVSQIETRLLGVKGVLDVDGTKINGAETNLELGEFETPVFGGVTG